MTGRELDASPHQGLSRWRVPTALAGIVIAVLVVYAPLWQAGFIWDDDTHLLNNPVLRPGGLALAWVPGTYLNFWPLTFTVYRAEFALWKTAPLGYHLVNVALHCVSALLLWKILRQLQVPGALFAAALFALHPVNVESVAWIAQLKGILALLFALISMSFYLAFEQRSGTWRYLLALAAFALSTLAKGMVITLPIVLLSCAWWQRGRIARRDVLRVFPYLLIGGAMAAIEIGSQHLVAADTVVRNDGLLSRTVTAGCAVWFYFGKILWPESLCFVYRRWQIDLSNPLIYLPGTALIALLAVGWLRRGTWGRPLLMLLVCYVGLLLPVLGFVNIYFMQYSLVADHWQYAAMIVPCAVFAGVTTALVKRFAPAAALGPVPIGPLLALLPLAALALLTWHQNHIYANDITLYRDTIEKNPQCWMAYTNLADALQKLNRPREAFDAYNAAIQLNPELPEAHFNLGNLLLEHGHPELAAPQYELALKWRPNYARAHNNLGNALLRLKNPAAAIEHYRAAIGQDNRYVEARSNLGAVLAMQGYLEEAIREFNAALAIQPNNVPLQNNLREAEILLEKKRQTHP